MIVQHHNRPVENTNMSDYPQYEPRKPNAVERFMGGRPTGVIVRLLLLSLVVGVLMSFFNVNVQQVVRGVIELFGSVVRDGFGVFGDLWGYVVTGAALVIPVWFVLRLTKSR
jgi:hypothetical protein